MKASLKRNMVSSAFDRHPGRLVSSAANRLHKYGAYDLHGITMVPEAKLYKEFGVNAELIIDHAWGREPCTIADIHAYRPIKHSISHSQILLRNYTYEERMCLCGKW